MAEKKHEIGIVYCVVRYGQIVGVYADQKEAFDIQMMSVNKGQLCDLVPKPIIYPEKL